MIDNSHLDWQSHVEAGLRYLKTATNGMARPSVFNNRLVYHLVAMAIERMLVGVYHYHRHMPEDHTLAGLVDGLAPLCPLDQFLAEGIKALGQFDDMCPLVPVKQTVPDDAQIKAILELGKQVAGFTRMQVSQQRMKTAV